MLNTDEIMYLMYMENCEKEEEKRRLEEYEKVNNENFEYLEPEKASHKLN